MKHCYCVLLILCLSTITKAQELKITNIRLADEKVEVHYDLIDDRIDRTYSVFLYTSKDNFIQSMEKVSGDVGVDIPIGHNKTIEWNAKEELGDDFDGSVALELKGNFYVPFITVDGIEKDQEVKRGKMNDFVWSGGRGDNVLNFELYRGNSLVETYEERPNTGKTSIMISNNVPPGENYRFKVSDSRNRDEVVYTEPFTVRRKMPLGVKLGGVLVVGIGIGYLIKTLIPEKENHIPEPPLPQL